MSVVDLRSDTVTRPTRAMRKAMADAVVGDDVFGDDPTVRDLEEETAALLGKEAAIFVPSGTMSNLIGLGLLAGSGTEVLVEEQSHILNLEAGGAAALLGITLRGVPGVEGRLEPDRILGAVRPEDPHVAPLVAVALENTHNRAGGAVWPKRSLDAAYAAAGEAGLSVHLDGSRLWNAAVASRATPSELAWGATTINVCFSKGLGAPIGSALVGNTEHIRRARFLRKRLGGGMRQVGVIAAGALHALRHHRDRIVEDHRRATELAAALQDYRGIHVLPVATNIVIFDLEGGPRRQPAVIADLAREGLLAHPVGDSRIRLITHLDIDDDDVDRAIAILNRVLGSGS